MGTLADSSRKVLMRGWSRVKSLGLSCTCSVFQETYNPEVADYVRTPVSTKEFLAVRDEYSVYERVAGIESSDFVLVFPVDSLSVPLERGMIVLVSGNSCKVVNFVLDITGTFYEVQVRG